MTPVRNTLISVWECYPLEGGSLPYYSLTSQTLQSEGAKHVTFQKWEGWGDTNCRSLPPNQLHRQTEPIHMVVGEEVLLYESLTTSFPQNFENPPPPLPSQKWYQLQLRLKNIFFGRYESVDCSTGMEWWNGTLE